MPADTIRTVAKHAAELLLHGAGATRLSRRLERASTFVLAYHNIVPEGAAHVGDRSLHLPQREFARQLDVLASTHEIVGLPSLLDERRDPTRPRAIITFDDAYRGAVTAGVEELARRRLPATVFVTPGYVGGRAFWWDVLADPARGLADGVRTHALAELGGRDARIRSWAKDAGRPLHRVPPHMTGAPEARLAAAARVDGITFAAHTWSHPNLAALAPPDLERELVRPLDWLRERFECTVPWLSYPYGLSSPDVERAASATGYDGAFRVSGGLIEDRHVDDRRFALPRINVPSGLSLNGFRLRTAGIGAR